MENSSIFPFVVNFLQGPIKQQAFAAVVIHSSKHCNQFYIIMVQNGDLQKASHVATAPLQFVAQLEK